MKVKNIEEWEVFINKTTEDLLLKLNLSNSSEEKYAKEILTQTLSGSIEEGIKNGMEIIRNNILSEYKAMGSVAIDLNSKSY